MNRDHFTRPDQGGRRSAQDYGQTNLEPVYTRHSRVEIALVLLFGLPVVTWIIGQALS